ncbi:hypothetical protein [Bradyrhizobium sp. LMG 9283]|uniref:hypothetical protein n=1 Tax=Bradyrhizobium sp. LMG 9283 TaxID=592064 RepID=UPI003890ABF4
MSNPTWMRGHQPAQDANANLSARYAAIALVLSLMPIPQLGDDKTDIAMSAVLSIALDADPRCALVLAHVIDRAEHDPHRADQLCRSWSEFYLSHSASRGGAAWPSGPC